MRIFLGIKEIAGQLPVLAEGFRALGHSVTTCIEEGKQHPFYPDLTYDIFLRNADPQQITSIIAAHDVFLFQFGQSLLPENRDFRMIKKQGKKIISFFNGSEVRYWQGHEQQFGYTYTNITNEPLPEYWKPYQLVKRISTLRRAEVYADLILSHPSHATLALRPYNHISAPILSEKYQAYIPNRTIPHVIHAPSDSSLKGTKIILSVLEELKQEGIQFELILLSGVSNAEVLSHLQKADCVIDQIFLSGGLFSVEAMCSGCAVATGYFPKIEGFSDVPPIHGLSLPTLKEDLRTFLTDRELRVKLAQAGTAHAKKYHDTVSLCRRILTSLAEGEHRIYDYWPYFYAKEFIIPEGLYIPDAYLKMTDDVIKKIGLPADADIDDMVRRGLVSPTLMETSVPAWGDIPEDCAQYRNKPILRGIPLPTYHNSKPLPNLLKNLERFNLEKIFLPKKFSSKLETILIQSLHYGKLNKAVDQFLSYEKNHTLSLHEIGAMGLLFWGCGLYDTAIKLFSLPNVRSTSPLISWLTAIGYLKLQNIPKAVALLKNVLHTISPITNKERIVFGSEQDLTTDTAYLITWQKPKIHSCYWYSPSVFIPNWCGLEQEDAIVSIITYICLAQGYRVNLSKGTTKLQGILRQLLTEHLS